MSIEPKGAGREFHETTPMDQIFTYVALPCCHFCHDGKYHTRTVKDTMGLANRIGRQCQLCDTSCLLDIP